MLNRRRNRRKVEPRTWQLPKVDLTGLLSVLALAGGLALIGYTFSIALDRPVARVDVEGPFQRVALPEIEAAIAPFTDSGFVSIDLDAVRASVEAIAWVDRARVERSWPDSIHVVVTEQVAAARWGEQGLLNTRGELFVENARHPPPELPRLDGPAGTEREVARLYLEAYPRLLAVGMRLARVELDPRGAWKLELANGVEVRLGRMDLEERLERFLRIASPLVATRQGEIAYIDMRYSNGFSVGWTSQVASAGDRSKSRIPDA
jgi:cell division protein FtsQ